MLSSLYGNYRNRKFTDIYPDYETFKTDFDSSPFKRCISDDSLNLTYYLIYAKYGNSTIASSDENQFKFRFYSIIFNYGPTWEKRLEIQKKLREMKDEDVLKGSYTVYNHAFNPSCAPATDTTTPLPKIDDQNVNNYMRGKIEGFTSLWASLDVDLSEYYIKKFAELFLKIVEPEVPLWYITDEEEN